MQIKRVGKCNGCGECCKTLNPIDQRPGQCLNYSYTPNYHCRVYLARPECCRTFPETPRDIATLPNCGYQFVDCETGKVIDAYMLLSTETHLNNAVKRRTQQRRKQN